MTPVPPAPSAAAVPLLSPLQEAGVPVALTVSGGGSVMDGSKFIALASQYEGNGEDILFSRSKPVRLTKAEYEVLVAFVAHAGRVLSRERILTLISHRGDGPSDRTIDVLIRRLRGKMEADPRDPQLFVTVHGEGYLFAGEIAS